MQSIQINADQTVTFRLRAPEAKTVQLHCDGIHDAAFAKNADGVWTFITAPLAPDVYHYVYVVDGVRTIDPGNPHIVSNLFGAENELVVPTPLSPSGAPPQVWELADVPRGTLARHFFKSGISGEESGFVVYTPPGYDPADPAKRYPVLYLLHGFFGDATSWTNGGRAHVILDNLAAAGKVRPMIVVMPHGYGTLEVVRAGWGGLDDRELNRQLWRRNYSDFDSILFGEIIPRVESAYRTTTERADRAIAGLSMGGTQSLDIGFRHVDSFTWIGAFSCGGLPTDFDAAYPTYGETTASRLRLLWLASGRENDTLASTDALAAWLKAKTPDTPLRVIVTDYGHTFRNWRRNLADFAPLLFQESRKSILQKRKNEVERIRAKPFNQ